MTEGKESNDAYIGQLLRNLVEQAGEYAVILLTPSGEIMWCNSGAERLFGAARADLVGRPSVEIFTREDRDAGLAGLEMAIAGADAKAADDRWHVRADGSTFWSSGVMLPLRDSATGSLLGFGKVVRDRTDLKTQIELLENQLRAVQRSEGEKDHAITKLSHELRNTIGGLRGAVELLDRPLDDAQRRSKFNQLMQRQLAIIERLTEDLLDVKRAGTGKVSLQLEPVVVQDEVRELLARYERRLIDRQLALQFLAPPADVIVNADRVRLHQIVGNLVDNAIKYTPSNGRIWVKINTDDKAAMIEIEDTGRGIPHDMLQRIFELFTQVDSQTSEGGLGVGLALVRELVLLHGGSVQASSKGAGKGSEFTVRLPLATVASGP